MKSTFSTSPDCLVIGAGIFGLWAARHAMMTGQSVMVVEKGAVGSGASGGFLGALMPHMPDTWNAKKQMQFDALSSLQNAIEQLEAETEMNCSYRRCGRLMPLRHEKMPQVAERRIKGSVKHWRDKNDQQPFHMQLIKPPFPDTIAEDWLSEEISPFGAVFDTLSARVDPRAYVKALAQSIRMGGTLKEGAEVVSMNPNINQVSFSDGSKINAGRIIIANGYEAYRLLKSIDAKHHKQPIIGRGVKGQATLLDFPHQDDQPIIYDDGSYVVPHANGRIAIGSTSVNDWQHSAVPQPDEFDPSDTDYFEHALKLAPALASAPTIEQWAAVRPRNTMPNPKTGKIGTDPFFGALDEYPNIKAAVGGFKISFAMAHLNWLE